MIQELWPPDDQQDLWNSSFRYLTLAYNSVVQESNSESPFFLMHWYTLEAPFTNSIGPALAAPSTLYR